MGKGLEQTFLWRGSIHDKQIHEEAHSIISDLRNETHSELPLHTHRMATSSEGENTEPRQGWEGTEPWQSLLVGV